PARLCRQHDVQPVRHVELVKALSLDLQHTTSDHRVHPANAILESDPTPTLIISQQKDAVLRMRVELSRQVLRCVYLEGVMTEYPDQELPDHGLPCAHQPDQH